MKNKYKCATHALLGILLLFSNSCGDDNSPAPELATLGTVTISAITSTTATGGGNITDDGGDEITERGVCWNTNANPTVSDSKTSDGTGTGAFESLLTELTENTTYHVRAYATNGVGTAYGDDVSFTTSGASTLTAPTVTTTPASLVSAISAISGGIVTSDGGAEVTMRGVCWSVSHDPTTDDDKTSDGPGTGSFTSNLSGLTPKTTYFVRAYATNNFGTAYGAEVPFTTLEENTGGEPGTVSDIDGNVYNAVAIGSQTWMAENLKTTTYNDGSAIPFITDSLGWMSDQLGAYTWFHDDINYKAAYGAIYNWYAVNTDKLCPVDWHVPGDDEWTTLENYLIANGYNYDGSTDGDRATNNKIAKALADLTTWNATTDEGAPGNDDFPNKRDASGFNARAGGVKDFYGSFGFFTQDGLWHKSEGLNGAWWTSSEIVEGATTVWWRQVSTYQVPVLRSHNEKYYGMSVRCVKN